MRVAVVQHAPRADVASTARFQCERIREAASLGARIVVLPEGARTGLAERRDEALAGAVPLDGEYVSSLASISASQRVCIVAHVYEEAVLGARRVAYNTAVLLEGGRVALAYRKIHLFDAQGHLESATVEPGDPSQATDLPVDVDGMSVAVLTCFDLRFGELAIARARSGAALLCVPAAWVAGPGKGAQWEVLCRARAIETGCFLAAAAQPGPRYCGGSSIWGPTGDAVAGPLGADGEGVAVADVDVSAVLAARAATPTLRHRPVWGAK